MNGEQQDSSPGNPDQSDGPGRMTRFDDQCGQTEVDIETDIEVDFDPMKAGLINAAVTILAAAPVEDTQAVRKAASAFLIQQFEEFTEAAGDLGESAA